MTPETIDGLMIELRAVELTERPASKGRRRKWTAFLLAGVTCLGGVSVAAPSVANFMGWQHDVPMKGLGIGQQLGWLTAKLSGSERQAR